MPTQMTTEPEVYAWSNVMGCMTQMPRSEAERKGYAWGHTVDDLRAAMAA